MPRRPASPSFSAYRAAGGQADRMASRSRARDRAIEQAASHVPSRDGVGGLSPSRIRDRGARYGMQFDEFPPDELDEKTATVLAAIGDNSRFAYEYDFGDSWEHEIVVEDRWRIPIGLKFGVCVDGAERCPPEDCGGRAVTSCSSKCWRTPPTISTRNCASGSTARSMRRSSISRSRMPGCKQCAERLQHNSHRSPRLGPPLQVSGNARPRRRNRTRCVGRDLRGCRQTPGQPVRARAH